MLSVAAPKNINDYIGSSGGSYFNDNHFWENRKITALKLNCGEFVNSIQVRYGNEWGPVHGGSSSKSCGDENIGNTYTYILRDTEYIHTIKGRYGAYIDHIVFVTNIRMLPKCGRDGGGTTKTTSGRRLMYISGRAGCHVDGIQPHWVLT